MLITEPRRKFIRDIRRLAYVSCRGFGWTDDLLRPSAVKAELLRVVKLFGKLKFRGILPF